jgi:hypothetical protein
MIRYLLTDSPMPDMEREILDEVRRDWGDTFDTQDAAEGEAKRLVLECDCEDPQYVYRVTVERVAVVEMEAEPQ